MVDEVKLIPAGVGELLRSPEVLADLKARAERIAMVAGPGHEVEAHVGPVRAHASVTAVSHAARRAEATAQRLTSAVDAGRG